MRVWHKSASETETGTGTHKPGQPWYLQEATVEESWTTPVLTPVPVPETPTHFEPEAAERILAWASLLQETHRQNLSKEQVEAIAAEVGIEAEFVRLAMEQEAAGVLPRQAAVYSEAVQAVRLAGSGPVAAAMVIYAVLGIPLLTLTRHGTSHNFDFFPILLIYTPAFLALLSGVYGGRRRLGLYWGAGFGILAVAAGLLSWIFSGDPVNLSALDGKFLAGMIVVGALLGLVGAETRRQVSRRRVRNRERRIVRRTNVP